MKNFAFYYSLSIFPGIHFTAGKFHFSFWTTWCSRAFRSLNTFWVVLRTLHKTICTKPSHYALFGAESRNKVTTFRTRSSTVFVNLIWTTTWLKVFESFIQSRWKHEFMHLHFRPAEIAVKTNWSCISICVRFSCVIFSEISYGFIKNKTRWILFRNNFTHFLLLPERTRTWWSTSSWMGEWMFRKTKRDQLNIFLQSCRLLNGANVDQPRSQLRQFSYLRVWIREIRSFTCLCFKRRCIRLWVDDI